MRFEGWRCANRFLAYLGSTCPRVEATPLAPVTDGSDGDPWQLTGGLISESYRVVRDERAYTLKAAAAYAAEFALNIAYVCLLWSRLT